MGLCLDPLKKKQTTSTMGPSGIHARTHTHTHVHKHLHACYQPTDRPTDRPTNQPTNQIIASTSSKTKENKNKRTNNRNHKYMHRKPQTQPQNKNTTAIHMTHLNAPERARSCVQACTHTINLHARLPPCQNKCNHVHVYIICIFTQTSYRKVRLSILSCLSATWYDMRQKYFEGHFDPLKQL